MHLNLIILIPSERSVWRGYSASYIHTQLDRNVSSHGLYSINPPPSYHSPGSPWGLYIPWDAYGIGSIPCIIKVCSRKLQVHSTRSLSGLVISGGVRRSQLYCTSLDCISFYLLTWLLFRAVASACTASIVRQKWNNSLSLKIFIDNTPTFIRMYLYIVLPRSIPHIENTKSKLIWMFKPTHAYPDLIGLHNSSFTQIVRPNLRAIKLPVN